MGGRLIFLVWIFMALHIPPPLAHPRSTPCGTPCVSRVHVEREQEKIRALVNKRQKKKGWEKSRRRKSSLFSLPFGFVFFCVFIFFAFLFLVSSFVFSACF